LVLYIYIKNKMGWACGKYGVRTGAHKVLVGKLEGKRLLGTPRRRWSITNIQEIYLRGFNWIDMA
jgi:hypothetical protein